MVPETGHNTFPHFTYIKVQDRFFLEMSGNVVNNNCGPNFPFTTPCNGHGICTQLSDIPLELYCLCNPDYVGNFIDAFVDPLSIHCFLPHIAAYWACVSTLIMFCLGALRLLYIVFYWVRHIQVNNMRALANFYEVFVN